MHDTVRLCKCCRNLLLSHLLELDYRKADAMEKARNVAKGKVLVEENAIKKVPRKFVKWDYYEMAYEMDVNSRLFLRHIPKVTETHVRRHKI